MKETKWYKNKNVWIIGILVIVIAVIYIIATARPKTPEISEDANAIELPAAMQLGGSNALAEEIEAPEPTPVPAEEAASLYDYGPGEEPAGYVYVSLPSSNSYGLLPLPKEGKVSYPLHQIFADGTETENVIILMPDGYYMGSSTCANQDCVDQGVVTFANREERILSNSVICLPNQVMLELYTTEEVAEFQQEAENAQAADGN